MWFRIISNNDIFRGISGLSYPKIAHPTSRISPPNFTEGEASQATSSLVGGPGISPAALLNPLQRTVKEVTRKGGVRKVKSKVKKLQKVDEVVYECLETAAVRRKGNEPELDSEDESSEGDERLKQLKLPSSSGTTDSSGEEEDSDGEKSVDSKEREDSEDEDEEEEDAARMPTLKSYDPQFISPQEPLRVKIAGGEHTVAPIEEIVAPTMKMHEPLKTNVVSEEQLKKTAAVEVPGSECLVGRNTRKNDVKTAVGAGEQFLEALEDEIFKTPEKIALKESEKSPAKKKMRAEKKKSKEVPNTEEVGLEVDRVGGEMAPTQEEGELQGEEDAQVGNDERVTGKDGHTSGLKKRKKRMEQEKDEEQFPTSMENLYSAKHTTLTALTDFAARQGIVEGGEDAKDDSESPQAPVKSPAGLGRVMTRVARCGIRITPEGT